MNDNNSESTSIEEADQKRRNMTMIMAGVVILGACVLFFLAFLWLRPGRFPLLAEVLATPTATRRPTRTPEPNLTPRPDLTATEQAWVKPAESPSLASVEEANAAFGSGAVYLETFASAKPEIPEIVQPGDLFLYDVQLPGSGQFPAAWSYGWCASQKAILEENFKSIQLEFIMNDTSVPLDHFVVLDDENSDGSACREYAALVTTWPEGQHHLETRVTFTQDVHDGWNLFPAGTHILKYIVTVE
ncbi:MAG TPA: hypothetical protein VFR47_21185 [Anaerolineales bacterium]|nr:hypothetical protein [Anaerolineales bacterium]